MDSIRISNVSGLVDGTYPFEWRSFSTAEWSWIKKLSGYLPATVEEGWVGRDPELVVAFAVIAMVRAGKIGKPQALTVGQLLWEADGDDVEITFVAGPDDAAGAVTADPPQVPPNDSSSSGSSGTSGSESSGSSGSPATIPSSSGPFGLVSVPTSDPAISAT